MPAIIRALHARRSLRARRRPSAEATLERKQIAARKRGDSFPFAARRERTFHAVTGKIAGDVSEVGHRVCTKVGRTEELEWRKVESTARFARPSSAFRPSVDLNPVAFRDTEHFIDRRHAAEHFQPRVFPQRPHAASLARPCGFPSCWPDRGPVGERRQFVTHNSKMPCRPMKPSWRQARHPIGR